MSREWIDYEPKELNADNAQRLAEKEKPFQDAMRDPEQVKAKQEEIDDWRIRDEMFGNPEAKPATTEQAIRGLQSDSESAAFGELHEIEIEDSIALKEAIEKARGDIRNARTE